VRVKKKKGLPSWLELFDTGEMDHVCDAVRVNIVNVSGGYPSLMNEPLRKYLLAPLDDYLAEHWEQGSRQVHVDAAQRFYEKAEKLAELFEDQWPFDEEDGKAWAYGLRFAWLEFIAYGAAHRMYHDLPAEQKQRVAASKKLRGNGRELTVKILAKHMRNVGATSLSDDLAESLAQQFKVGVRTVRRRLSEAKKAGLLP